MSVATIYRPCAQGLRRVVQDLFHDTRMHYFVAVRGFYSLRWPIHPSQ